MLPTMPLPGFHLSCLWFCLNDYNRIYSTANLSPVNHYFVRHKRFDLDLHHQHLEEYQPSLKGIVVVVVFLNLPLFNIYFSFHLKIVQCPGLMWVEFELQIKTKDFTTSIRLHTILFYIKELWRPNFNSNFIYKWELIFRLYMHSCTDLDNDDFIGSKLNLN